jgi:hypothetical protein
MATIRTVVIGTATSYRWNSLKPFVVSLRQSGFSGGIILLVETKWLETSDFEAFRRHNVTLYPIFPILSRIPEFIRKHRFKSPFNRLEPMAALLGRSFDAALACPHKWRFKGISWFHPIASARFFIYRTLINDLLHRYDHFLLSDVRDVAFQVNPDSWIARDPLQLFWERNAVTIGNEPVNSRWIRLLYGEAILESLSSMPVSCSGIVAGNHSGITTYLESMTEEVAKHARAVGAENGFDQGIHNYLLHAGRFGDARIHSNETGPVLNMHGLRPDQWYVDGRNRVCRSDGTAIPLLHQYDRHTDLRLRLLQSFEE